MRMPLPKTIENAPVLLPGLDLFYVAFMDLTTCRSVGFGEGPIPWDKTSEWCDRNDLDDEQREDMHFHITRLDTVYLKHRGKQAHKPTTKDAKG